MSELLPEPSPDPTEAPRPPVAPPAAAPDPTAPLRKILEALVPENGTQITFEDLLGHRYESPSKVGLRIQGKLVRILHRHWPALSAAVDGGGGSILAAIASEEVEADLVAAMELLHPEACRLAVARARSAAEEAGRDSTGLGVGDAFDVELIAQAILPFFVAPILKLLEAVRTAGLVRS